MNARELIRSYRESEWRSRRLEVLRQMGSFQDFRSLQFLIEISKKNEDLAEQQLAILALSQRKSRSAQVFLRRFYQSIGQSSSGGSSEDSSDTLKPVLAYALGQAHDFGSTQLLLKDWDQAYAQQNWLWLRNIILALGELKAFEVLPKLRNLLANLSSNETELMQATWFALARLERDPAQVPPLANLAENQQKNQQMNQQMSFSLVFQIYQMALSQIQIRSQFKLEDYLQKIFENANPHPVLPLELKAFDADEVKVGLSLFSVQDDWKRFLFALRGVNAQERVSDLKTMSDFLQRDGVPASDLCVFLAEVAPLLEESNHLEVLEILKPFSNHPEESVYLQWMDCVAPWMPLQSFIQKNPTIPFLNLWSEWALVKGESAKGESISESIEAWMKEKTLSPFVRARIIRACAELNVKIKDFESNFKRDFSVSEMKSSLLLYLEHFPNAVSFSVFSETLKRFRQTTSPAELEQIGARILGALEAYAEEATLKQNPLRFDEDLDRLLEFFAHHFNLDLQNGVLRILRHVSPDSWEQYCIEKSQHQEPAVQVNAVIALKRYENSRKASEALIEALTLSSKSKSKIVQGRTLDALCAHRTLLAKRAVIQYLEENLHDEETVDKIYRSFDPGKSPGSSATNKSEEFLKALEKILRESGNAELHHPQWEKLVSLRDRLALSAPESLDSSQSETIRVVDEKLTLVIPLFGKLEATIQLALRAAEQPFQQNQDFQNLPIDKAPTVLEYCKALDLILDRHLGHQHLFPKLDQRLHDFQTLWHRVGFGEDYPSVDKVLSSLGLTGKISPENFPLHKARMMCGTFFNGKILQDRFKVFDGLRAWAVIFLIFARKIPLASGSIGPLLKVPKATDEKCISIAKRLMVLQDLRNPAAHRQTYPDLASVKNVRSEAIDLLNTVLNVVLEA